MQPETELHVLQSAVAVASLVPICAGAAGVILGPDFVSGGHSADILSHFRYLSGLLLGIGLAFLFTVPRLNRHSPLFAVLAAIVFLGGLARLWSAIDTGWPSMPHRLALVMELAITPALALWHRRIVQRCTP